MKLEDQVCSLESAKRLKELGIRQDSYFIWANDKLIPRNSALGLDNHALFEKQIFAAFTIAELGEMLPDSIDGNKFLKNNNDILFHLNGHFIKSQKKDDEYKIYIDALDKCTMFISKNEANARASMLIYLIENNLISM